MDSKNLNETSKTIFESDAIYIYIVHSNLSYASKDWEWLKLLYNKLKCPKQRQIWYTNNLVNFV